MLHNRKIYGFLAGLTMVMLSGCYKVTTLVLNNEQEVTTPVSFNADIVPIFAKSCTATGCHNSGGQVPDLTAANAYNSLFLEDMIDVDKPESSELYLWLTGQLKPAMPLGAESNPSNINQLTLAWIKQGAKNN